MFRHTHLHNGQGAHGGRRWRHGAGLTLTDGQAGERLVVTRFTQGLGCTQRLRELGLMEGKIVVVLRASDPVLLALDDSRLALERTVSDRIEVERVQ